MRGSSSSGCAERSRVSWPEGAPWYDGDQGAIKTQCGFAGAPARNFIVGAGVRPAAGW